LQSILGHPVSTDTYTSSRFNLIVNDVGSFCLLNAIIALTGFKGQINLIPSTNVSSIPLMCNIFMGWGMEFGVLLFDNDVEIGIGESLKKNVFKTESSGNELVIKMPGMFHNAEDLLSTLDFKNHILNSREGITIPNSQYTKEKEVPRNFVFSRFLSNVQEGLIKPSDFDEESLENFKLVTDLLKALK
ncbi:MAG TPA: hypothetical protein VK861_07405, partial [Bacteroidales bacterium]|nr:hypothetical protein [Bacteroidales bacterium]